MTKTPVIPEQSRQSLSLFKHLQKLFFANSIIFNYVQENIKMSILLFSSNSNPQVLTLFGKVLLRLLV